MVEDAIRANQHKKMAKKGFSHVIVQGDRMVYCKSAPTPAQVKQYFGDKTVEVTAL
jgi:hypothetical protein